MVTDGVHFSPAKILLPTIKQYGKNGRLLFNSTSQWLFHPEEDGSAGIHSFICCKLLCWNVLDPGLQVRMMWMLQLPLNTTISFPR